MIFIETDYFIIRDHIETDLEAYHLLYSDQIVMKYLDFRSNADSKKKQNY